MVMAPVVYPSVAQTVTVSPKVKSKGAPVSVRVSGFQERPAGGEGHAKYTDPPMGEVPENVMGSIWTY